MNAEHLSFLPRIRSPRILYVSYTQGYRISSLIIFYFFSNHYVCNVSNCKWSCYRWQVCEYFFDVASKKRVDIFSLELRIKINFCNYFKAATIVCYLFQATRRSVALIRERGKEYREIKEGRKKGGRGGSRGWVIDGRQSVGSWTRRKLIRVGRKFN